MAKTLQQIDVELGEIAEKQKGILDAADENGGKLSAEQKTEWDSLSEQYVSLKSRREMQEEAEHRAADAAALAAESGRLPRNIQPDELAVDTTSANDIRVKDNLTTYQLSTGELVTKPAFHCLGDQLQAIAGVAMSGRDNDMLAWESLAPATGSAQAGVPSDGGYLIQKQFAADLFSRMSSAGTLFDPELPQPTEVPIGANADGLKTTVIDETSRATGSRWGGVQMYWGAENDAATAKKPKTRQMELELKDLIGLAYASNRLLQDATAMGAIFSQAFSDEARFMLADARINGTGAGQPKGILSTTGASATISVTKETNQPASTIVYKNIVKMWSRLWSRSQSTAIWCINQDCLPQILTMTMPTGTGAAPVYLPPGGMSGAPYGTIFGRPVVHIENCATLGTVGDIILWDPTQYVEISKGELQSDSSIHVRFTTNESTFRYILRRDGQPFWNSALTPFKGSNTQSPQITLATRA